MSGAWNEWEGELIDGRFRLQQFLGAGPQSVVYRTETPEVRDAVIKLVQIAPLDVATELSRWQQAAALSHPSLSPIIHYGSCDPPGSGLIYVVMEYSEENLAGVISDRALTDEEGREMLTPILDALSYLHTQGFAHGHLKPANILASADQLKVSCDRIGRVGELGGGRGHPGPYDPPEFEIEGMSAPGDLWSLGATLVESLTQNVPAGEQAGDSPVLAGFSEPLRSIARGCLSANPKSRPSVADLTARLRPAPRAELPRLEKPPGAEERRSYARPLAVVAGVALAAILLAASLLHRDTAATTSVSNKPVAEAAAPPTAPAAVTPAVPAAEPSAAPEPPPPPKSNAPAAKKAPKPKPFSDDPPPKTERAAKASPPDTTGATIKKVMPDIPSQARSTIHGTVRLSVRAKVAASGHVTDAAIESASSRYLGNLAVEAARQWEFQPSSAATDWILHFEITRSTANAKATPAR
jgi:TonB family protein